ncbi:MAG: hypothetical protein A4S16_09485 [Proteobacteria bacterium SG_bin6]|nr:MAG: hypothetical protein A4S16_09485 [Proteobacteria bacterium SG_bin6]
MLRLVYWPVLGSLVLNGVSANAQTRSIYCGPDIPASRYANPVFNGETLTFRIIESQGQRILLAEGGIGPDDGNRFQQALTQAGAIDEVWLSSPGGIVDSGLQIGRIMRKRGIAVRVPSGRACISSCTIAFLGGVIRIVDDDAYYGIHMFSGYGFGRSGMDEAKRFNEIVLKAKAERGDEFAKLLYTELFRGIEQRAATRAADMSRYLIEMSASLDFLTGMTGQPIRGVCYVTREGLKRYNVVNTN